MKKTLQLLPELDTILSKCQGELLKTIAQNVRAASAGLIKHEIDKLLEDDATISKKKGEHLRTQVCFLARRRVGRHLSLLSLRRLRLKHCLAPEPPCVIVSVF